MADAKTATKAKKDEATMVDVEIIKGNHYHKGQPVAKGEKIQMTKAAAERLQTKGACKIV